MSFVERQIPPGPQRRNPLWIWVFIALALAALFWKDRGGNVHDPNAVPRAIVARGELADDEKATIALFRQASPSVVNITSLALRRDAFRLDVMEIPKGAGTGFVWDEQGHIVTNFHVIESAEVAKVTLADRSTWEARLVGVEPDKDLAVLKIDAPKAKLPPLILGTSRDLSVGQKVFAIGNPFGLDQTLTTGIISGLGREIQSMTKRPIQGVIQTDAAINPGNSGGPLLDSAGRLIGVNTAIYSPSGTSAGIGFAVPVDTVNRIVPQIIRHGRAERVGLGVNIAEDQIVEQLGLQGVLVLTVREGSPAAAAGVRPTTYDANDRIHLGDLIVAINGEPIKDTNGLYRILERFQAGDVVKVKIQRDQHEQELDIPLAVLPQGR